MYIFTKCSIHIHCNSTTSTNRAYTYEPELKKLNPINPAETHPTIIYCRDPEWVHLRVGIADKVKAFPQSFETRD